MDISKFRAKIGFVATLLATSTLVAIASPPAVGQALSPALTITPINPARLLETRPNQSTVDGKFNGIGRVKAGAFVELQVTGRAGVPNGASAVMLNVTAVFPTEGTALTVWACDAKQPKTSNLNVPVGDIRANVVFSQLNADGKVCVLTTSETDIVVDVNGYVPGSGTPNGLYPARLLETRSGESTVDGKLNGIGRRKAGSVTTVKVAGRGGVPEDADSAFLNVTAIFPSAGTVLTVYPCSPAGVPDASSLNVPVGDIGANGVLARLSSEGEVCIYTASEADIVVDVGGYVPEGSQPTGTDPARLLETRPGNKTVDGQSNGIGRLKAGSITEVQVTGRADVPGTARGAVLNVTAVSPDPGTVVTAYPCDTDTPTASNLNAPVGSIRANGTFVKLSASGKVCLYTAQPVDLVVDLNGYVNGLATNEVCSSSTSSLPESECGALIALYNYNGGSSWKSSTGWGSGTDPCTWKGVVCTNKHITALRLDANNVTGELTREIASLTELTELTLDENAITSLPIEFGQLTKLEKLGLSDNEMAFDLTGAFLPLKNANKMTNLYLSGNNCLTTTDSGLATWLAGLDPKWNDGC